MSPADTCPGSDHRAPLTGGSCGCGMVTLVPARTSGLRPEVRELLARCLDDGPGDRSAVRGAAALVAPPERVDRLLAALAEAGLALTPRLSA